MTTHEASVCASSFLKTHNKKSQLADGWDAIPGLWKDHDVDAIDYQRQIRDAADGIEDAVLLKIVAARKNIKKNFVSHKTAWE